MLSSKRCLLLVIQMLAIVVRCLGQDDELRSNVAYLADSVGNRSPGSYGDLIVREHIARQFIEYGLESEVQPFDIVEKIWGEGTLQLLKSDVVVNFTLDREFVVSGRSATDTLSSEYVVVGGVLPDSLRNLVLDKVVICLQKASALGRGAQINTVAELEDAGARAAIYVYPPKSQVKRTVSKGNRVYQSYRIPVLFINYDELVEFIPQSVVDTLAAGSIYIAPLLYKIQIATKHCEKYLHAANVIGIKRGYSTKYIIVGAHYDTIAPDNAGGLRPGANDNASGVAMLLALANRMNSIGTYHNIIFIAFGGEEKGALGSMNFVDRMPFPKDYVSEMINIDMVGRMEQGLLYYRQFNATRIKPTDLQLRTLVLTEGECGMSDHYDFINAGIPVSYFHTGYDQQIHTREDTSDRLNYEGMNKILDFLSDYILAIDAGLIPL